MDSIIDPIGIERVVVINDDATEQGGAAAIALLSTKLLNARHIPVTFLSGSADIDPELEGSGAEIGVLGGRHILDGPRGTAAVRGLFDPTIQTRLAQWIAVRDTPGTVYHLHNWHKVLSPSVFGALRRVAHRLVISAHDDIFGEIFRNLDKLRPGDELQIYTASQIYTYVITASKLVAPTDVSVMNATSHPSATLISCYPYLVDKQRIVVFADLKTQ